MNVLDNGEASVIQMALDKQISAVCIDEAAGRRIARLAGLLITGSIGILIRAKNEGLISSLSDAIQNMESRGIWIGERVKTVALREAGETP